MLCVFHILTHLQMNYNVKEKVFFGSLCSATARQGFWHNYNGKTTEFTMTVQGIRSGYLTSWGTALCCNNMQNEDRTGRMADQKISEPITQVLVRSSSIHGRQQDPPSKKVLYCIARNVNFCLYSFIQFDSSLWVYKSLL